MDEPGREKLKDPKGFLMIRQKTFAKKGAVTAFPYMQGPRYVFLAYYLETVRVMIETMEAFGKTLTPPLSGSVMETLLILQICSGEVFDRVTPPHTPISYLQARMGEIFSHSSRTLVNERITLCIDMGMAERFAPKTRLYTRGSDFSFFEIPLDFDRYPLVGLTPKGVEVTTYFAMKYADVARSFGFDEGATSPKYNFPTLKTEKWKIKPGASVFLAQG
jgi:hypothetical protein